MAVKVVKHKRKLGIARGQSLASNCKNLPVFGANKASIVCVVDPIIGHGKFPINKNELTKLSQLFKQNGIYKEDVVFISASRPCSKEIWDLQSKLSAHLKEDYDELLEGIKKLKPKLILAFGSASNRQIAGRAVKITKIRGLPHRHSELGCLVLPCNSIRQYIAYPESRDLFRADIESAGRIVQDNFKIKFKNRVKENYNWVTSIKRLLRKPPKILSVDVETVGLRSYEAKTKLLTVQLCWAPGKAIAIPIDYNPFNDDGGILDDISWRPNRPINKKLRLRLIRQLKKLLENPNVRCIGHNLKFDYQILRDKLGIKIANYRDDTILMMHAVDENMRQKNLADSTSRFVPEMAGYSHSFDSDPVHLGKTRMDLVPPGKLKKYGCGDTDAALRLRKKALKLLKADKKQYRSYRKVRMPAQGAFCNIEQTGFHIDVDALHDLAKKVRNHQRRQERRILKHVHPEIKSEISATGVGLKITRAAFLKALLFHHKKGLNFKPLVFTKTGEPSVSAKDHLPYFEEAHKVIPIIIDYIKNQKLLDTYIGVPFDEKKKKPTGLYQYIVNGRIRPSYNFFTTVTGRSSCLKADVLVDTKRGKVRADDIQVGDSVWTHKGRWREVLKLYRKPAEEMYTVKFSNGEVLTCTGQHKLLLNDGSWSTVTKLIDQGYNYAVSKPEAYSGQKINQSGGEDLPNHNDDRAGSSGSSRGKPRDRQTYDPCSHTGRKVQYVESYSLQRKQTSGEESSIWQQMGVRIGGWGRVSDSTSRRGKISSASDSNGRTSRGTSEGSAEIHGCSPHRRGPQKQQYRQPSSLHSTGTCDDTRDVSNAFRGYDIQEINCAGVHRVYDFWVAEDNSYLASGVFSHNSKDPNGQNFPKRGPFAKDYRKIFLAPPGYVLLECDLSQAELRIAAILSGDRTMLDVYARGGDIHATTAAYVMGITIEEFNELPEEERSLQRYRAKSINFGFLYGMGWRKFMRYARTEYGIKFTEKQAKQIRNAFFKLYPGLQYWHQDVRNFVVDHGYVRSLTGEKRNLPNIHSDDEGIAAEAVRQAINSPVQSFASDLVIMAIARICNDVDTSFVNVIGFIHDSIVSLVPEGEAIAAARTVKHYMENNPLEREFGFESPIPFIADVSVGRNGCDMIELPKKIIENKKIRSIKSAKRKLTKKQRMLLAA